MKKEENNEIEELKEEIIILEEIPKEEMTSLKKEKNYIIPGSILLASLIIAGSLVYATNKNNPSSTKEEAKVSALEQKVIPAKGVTLNVKWGDLGVKLTESGTIDADKFKALYQQRDQLTNEDRNLLVGANNGKIKITSENSGYLLNLFWALGLANKNEILEKGEMVDPKYGGAGNFASTGGWTIAKGSAMDHYSKHTMINLTPEQQSLVDKVSRGIYRPCCGNSVHFPDCNHGMAMLGLLELMASQGATEQEMWSTALTVNSYWFPDTYLTIATYMKSKGVEWKDVNPQEILGADYSSAQGFANIAAQVTQPESTQQKGGGCDVGGAPVAQPQQKKQQGCGV